MLPDNIDIRGCTEYCFDLWYVAQIICT